MAQSGFKSFVRENRGLVLTGTLLLNIFAFIFIPKMIVESAWFKDYVRGEISHFVGINSSNVTFRKIELGFFSFTMHDFRAVKDSDGEKHELINVKSLRAQIVFLVLSYRLKLQVVMNDSAKAQMTYYTTLSRVWRSYRQAGKQNYAQDTGDWLAKIENVPLSVFAQLFGGLVDPTAVEGILDCRVDLRRSAPFGFTNTTGRVDFGLREAKFKDAQFQVNKQILQGITFEDIAGVVDITPGVMTLREPLSIHSSLGGVQIEGEAHTQKEPSGDEVFKFNIHITRSGDGALFAILAKMLHCPGASPRLDLQGKWGNLTCLN